MSSNYEYLIPVLESAFEKYLKGKLHILIAGKLAWIANPAVSLAVSLAGKYVFRPVLVFAYNEIEEYVVKRMSRARAMELVGATNDQEFIDAFERI